MREILFRAKAEYGGRGIEAGEWVEGFYYYKQYGYAGDKEYFGGRHKITTGIVEARGAYQESSDEVEYSIIPETLGQYTGLTDENDKKIFEGDVVDFYGKRYTVEFSEDRGGYYPFACGDGCGCCEDDTLPPSCAEVIGNIHDNPELMKEGKANE